MQARCSVQLSRLMSALNVQNHILTKWNYVSKNKWRQSERKIGVFESQAHFWNVYDSMANNNIPTQNTHYAHTHVHDYAHTVYNSL